MAKIKRRTTPIKKAKNGRAKPLVAKATVTTDRTRRYGCGGHIKKVNK